MTKMFLLLFVIFVSSQGILLNGNAQTGTNGPSLDDKRYITLMDLLIVERRSRSKLETAVAQELLALRQEIAKCQCGNGNGGHTQTINQGSLTNDTKTLEEEIIHLKRDKALLQTQVASLMQNNTILKDNVILLERSLHTMKNTQCDLNIRNETNHLEKALQITGNKLNAVINDANARKQDFIALLQQFIGLNQNHTTLKNKVMLLERTISTMAYSRKQSFIGLSEKVAGLLQNHTVLKGNVIQLERTFTMENTKCRNETSHLERALQITNNKMMTAKIEANSRNQSFIALSENVAGLIQNSTALKDNVMQLERNFTMENTKCRNETSHLERALQITNNKLNAIANDANARKHDFIALLQKVQSTEQRLENSTRSLEASQNMTFLKLQTEIINGAKLAEQNLSDRTKLLEMRENSTSLKLQQQTDLLQQELTKMSNRGKTINGTCETSSECEGKLICIHGNCQCSADSFWNGNQCVLRKPISAKCEGSSECEGKLICIHGNCQCSADSFRNGNQCVLRKTINAKCETSPECEGKLICIHGNCQCSADFFWNDNQCILRKHISAKCEGSPECEENLICIHGNCQCPADDPCWNGKQCVFRPTECEDITETDDGVYTIYPNCDEPVLVYCIMEQNKKWTVIQRRVNGSVDFNRIWKDYTMGFGSPYGEYWLGNELIHSISTDGQHELSIYMETSTKHQTANYSTFSVGNEKSKYLLTVTGFSGSKDDNMDRCNATGGSANGEKFSTKDKDNDSGRRHCAVIFKGGWWYNNCYCANFNKLYSSGMSWYGWSENIKKSIMMIRRTQ